MWPPGIADFSSIDLLSCEELPSRFCCLDKIIEDDNYEYTKTILAELKYSPVEEKIVNYLFSKFSELDDGHPSFAYILSRDEGKKPDLETFKEVFGLMLPVTFLKDEISSHIQPFFQDNDGPLN